MAGKVRVVFWDLGGVILRTKDPAPRQAWEQRLGLKPGDLARIVFDGPTSVEATVGRATADQVWASVGSQLGLTPIEREQLRAEFFAADEVDQDLMSYIRGLRTRTRVGLISNAWPEVRKLVETTWRIADAFEPLILSAEVGVAKPDHRIFRLALERVSVEPPQAIFVDDFPENVEAARGVGMRAVLFRTAGQAKEETGRLLGEG